MELKNEDNYMFSMKILNRVTFCFMSNSYFSKVSSLYTIKIISAIEMMNLCIVIILSVFHICFFSNSIIDIAGYAQLISSGSITLFKLYKFITNFDMITKLIEITSMKNDLYKYKNINILKNGKRKSAHIFLYIVFGWLAVWIGWGLTPLLSKDAFIDITYNNETYHYRYNVYNFVYHSDSDKSYNENFYKQYPIEVISIFLWVHCLMLFDGFLFSLCTAIIYKLKCIGHSYSNFGNAHKYIISKL